jgi:hypothetical protein
MNPRKHAHETQLPRVRLLSMLPLAAAVVFSMGPAAAHSWYPRWCCQDQDCTKVDRMLWNPDGTLHLESGPVSVDVPKNFLIQPSQDTDAHMCVYKDPTGRNVIRCVFLPATS